MTDLFDRLGQINDIITGQSVPEGVEQPEVDDVHVDPSLDDAELPAGGGTYSDADRVAGRALPGTLALQDYLLANFGGSNGGTYVNRDVRGRPGILSQHATGRAGDVMADTPTGDRIAQFLVTNADRLGIQQVIWNRRSWNSRTRQWKPYNGAHDHADHVHWELTKEAAAGTTRGSSRTAPAADVTPTSGGGLFDRLSAISRIISGDNPRELGVKREAGGEYAARLGMQPSGDRTKRSYQEYARSKLEGFGWDPSEFAALDQLVMKESGWNPTAQNPTSTAFGIGQFLDATWAGVGMEKTSDPFRQIDGLLAYVKARYGSPRAALAFHRRKGFY